VNGFLLGVRVPPGRHVIETSIDATPLLAGFGIAAVALLVTVLLAVGVPSRDRPTPSGGVVPTPPATPRGP